MADQQRKYDQMVLDTCILAGTIMIESGSEMTRVNDTILRIAHNAGLKDAKVYVTVTGIIMSGGVSDVGAQVGSIDKRSFDLEKVAKVNELSRSFAAKQIDIQNFYDQLIHIDDIVGTFPLWVQEIGAGIVSGTLVVVFRNNLADFWITFLVGMVGWAVLYFLNIYVQIRFLSEFLAAAAVAALAILSVQFGLGHQADDIIVGGMMPLVPGIPLTNAVRDALSGNLISGPARGIEALISACALGFGVAIALHFM
ncbi:MAG: threonine/serine exporter family protein [Lentilactobacillus diolivorans]|jgi:uncharacterized membrane protein YjjP (DUF1212 family)|uniref:Threonine/serine exporter-like N-terminal domain-containing protein n=2 Tax=Lentilactobacillus diolivorans TaxID=179838 RepID=A0A0R1S8P7_9LACO|nr:threonine/serine exporter family protein [Lentilactobacillus diolivorans]RRG03306.1 MAG: threonine/serine exporter [Lactobacillus sp.]KRL65343.1 hypothetical protein FC85_GL000167 [Lentilactobacillus diolivorans DSM 14421]MCH4163756.1 threonine/serine exporter family protein [Lentilactobacillus diolivorans]MDH5105456.1 threonine/serine exporter family protein [Lentilactobacillus diolivorans]GEP24427.1 membrane protein [Lentilactobacillus diolivorans]